MQHELAFINPQNPIYSPERRKEKKRKRISQNFPSIYTLNQYILMFLYPFCTIIPPTLYFCTFSLAHFSIHPLATTFQPSTAPYMYILYIINRNIRNIVYIHIILICMSVYVYVHCDRLKAKVCIAWGIRQMPWTWIF